MSGIWGYDWKLRGIIISQNIFIIGLFVGGGWLLDIQMDTKPLFVLLGLIFSFIINQLVSIKIIKWYIKGKPVYDPNDPKNKPDSTQQTL